MKPLWQDVPRSAQGPRASVVFYGFRLVLGRFQGLCSCSLILPTKASLFHSLIGAKYCSYVRRGQAQDSEQPTARPLSHRQMLVFVAMYHLGSGRLWGLPILR